MESSVPCRVPKANSHSALHSKFAPRPPSPLSASFTGPVPYGTASEVLPSSTASTSINYGDGEEDAAATASTAASRPAPRSNKHQPRVTVTAIARPGQSLSPVRTPLAPTWRDWSPGRGPASMDGRRSNRKEDRASRPPPGDSDSGSDRQAQAQTQTQTRRERIKDADAAHLKARRSMDWSTVMQNEQAGGKHKEKVETKETKGSEEAKNKKNKDKKRKDHDKHASESDNSDSGHDHSHSESESSDDSSEGEPLIKKKKAKAKTKTKAKEHAKHNTAEKAKKAKHGSTKKAHKHKKTMEELMEEGYLPIYMERERATLPLMEPFAQVLGLIGWQVATFVLGLSLGIFLSGITPGYDVADVGINSHWWNVDLNKPIFQPPDDVLAPMWITTFALAALGMWAIWLCMFFFLHELLLSVLTALLGWVVMLVCLISFCKRSWISVGFLAPAFVWKTFVVFDVLAIWWLNNSELA